MTDGWQRPFASDLPGAPRRLHELRLVDGGAAGRRSVRSDVPGSAADTARICTDILANAGPVAALSFLNARTRFRFTGIYRADPPLLRNVRMFDRENPTINVSGDELPLDDTYCALVWGEDRPFATRHSLTDARVAKHAARARVQSYGGVPIRDTGGRILGTLCHHDVRPRLLPRSEIGVLELVAPCFAERLAT